MIVLNGASSSGKSGIARCLQAVLPDPWLAFGTDNLVQAMPMSLQTSAAGIEFGKDGEVIGELDKALIGPPAVMSEHDPDLFFPEL